MYVERKSESCRAIEDQEDQHVSSHPSFFLAKRQKFDDSVGATYFIESIESTSQTAAWIRGNSCMVRTCSSFVLVQSCRKRRPGPFCSFARSLTKLKTKALFGSSCTVHVADNGAKKETFENDGWEKKTFLMCRAPSTYGFSVSSPLSSGSRNLQRECSTEISIFI